MQVINSTDKGKTVWEELYVTSDFKKYFVVYDFQYSILFLSPPHVILIKTNAYFLNLGFLEMCETEGDQYTCRSFRHVKSVVEM